MRLSAWSAALAALLLTSAAGAEQPASFWMENTFIPLDMLFIKADGSVESIAERTTPLSRRSVPSKGPVRFVLEINGGLSAALGIKPGAKVSGPAIDNRRAR